MGGRLYSMLDCLGAIFSQAHLQLLVSNPKIKVWSTSKDGAY